MTDPIADMLTRIRNAVSAKHTGILDLSKATDAEFVQLTTSGASNKEPAWFRPGR